MKKGCRNNADTCRYNTLIKGFIKGIHFLYTMEKIFKCKKCNYTLFDRLNKISFKCQKCGTINNFILLQKLKVK